ncbi:hypothetical protein ONZ45_g1348 [Pleurotus djamor]|nr:hypothetical protein ONZ45_g1348 [Pleurotus djamor]
MTLKDILDSSTIEEAAQLDIYDGDGAKVKFGSLFEKQKMVIVFVRHFICGSCQMYLEELAKIKDEAMEKAGIKFAVVGCGEWKTIKTYAEITGFQGKIYADPTRKLYHTLGMTIETIKLAPAGVPVKSYVSRGPVANANAIMNPSMIGNSGHPAQLGGDFIFGPGMTCTYAARMENTQDHVEIAELMEAAGIEYP